MRMNGSIRANLINLSFPASAHVKNIVSEIFVRKFEIFVRKFEIFARKFEIEIKFVKCKELGNNSTA